MCVTTPSCAVASTTASGGMATPSSNFASATARYVRGVRYATSRDVVISTTSVRASSASRSKIWTPASADTVNVGPAAQTDIGIVKATSEKANVTASPLIVLGIFRSVPPTRQWYAHNATIAELHQFSTPPAARPTAWGAGDGF